MDRRRWAVASSCWKLATVNWSTDLLLYGFADDFIQGRDPIGGHRDAEFSQRDHPVATRFFTKFVGRCVTEHHVSNGVVQQHQLEQRDAAFVAGVVAVVATGSLEELFVLDVFRLHPQVHQHRGRDFGFFAALGADATHQPLSQDRFDGGTNHERLDAHVFQSRDRCRRVVGVQRAEHQVAGQRRLNRDLGGFQVADFADQDRIGVLPQDRAQATGKGHTDVIIDRNLDDAVDVVLDRVFGGNQLVRDLVQLGQR